MAFQDDKQKDAIIKVLNEILEIEMAGVVCYTHYSFMVFGHSRIPIIKWLKEQANECLLHAQMAGEHITQLGGHPSLKIGTLLETHQHSINKILEESVEHERKGIEKYYALLALVEGKSIYLEEYARSMIAEEEGHVGSIEKMLRHPA